MGLLTDLLGDGNATSGYAPTELYLSAASLQIVQGSPTRTHVNFAVPVLQFPDAGGDMRVGSLIEHDWAGLGWATFDVIVEWANAGTGTGNVALPGLYAIHGPGDDLTTARTIKPDEGYATGAQNILMETTLFSGLATPAAGKRVSIGTGRRSDLAMDTLANAINVRGVILRKAS